jgi:hypothetical protein
MQKHSYKMDNDSHMNNDTKIKIIERFDFYYSGINNKGAFLLALNTFLIGAFIAGYKGLIEIIDKQNRQIFDSLMGMILLLSIISMIFTILAIFPYLRSIHLNNIKSNWFFNDIVAVTKAEFFDRISSSTEQSQTDDLNNQIYELANGLNIKHSHIRAALICNIVEVFLLIPIICIILI